MRLDIEDLLEDEHLSVATHKRLENMARILGDLENSLLFDELELASQGD